MHIECRSAWGRPITIGCFFMYFLVSDHHLEILTYRYKREQLITGSLPNSDV